MSNEKLQKLGNEANKLFQEKKWDMAIAKLDEMVALLPDDETKAAVLNNRGNAKNSMGDYEGAIADYGQALKINPQLADTYINRGIAKNRMGGHEGAIADYDRALEINPQLAEAYISRGVAKDGMGNYEDAIADYNRALEINPQDAAVYHNRGSTKSNMGDHKSAIADYDRALEINPQLAEAYYNRGNAKNHMGNHEDAIADYDRALKIDPYHKNTIHNRAIALSMQASHEGRKEIDAKYMALARERLKQAIKAGEDLIKSEEYEESLKKYTRQADYRGGWVWFFSLLLTLAAFAVYGIIAYFGIKEWQTTQSPMAMRVFSPLSLFPFILVGTLALSPLVWIIRMLNRDKHKYWALREDAVANLNLVRIIKSSEEKEKLWLQLFDHYDKRGSAHLIADWNRADTGDNSVSVQDILNLVKPGGKGGD